MIVIENHFDHGQTVYLKTDIEQYPYIVIYITIYKGGEVIYGLRCGTEQSTHYDFEISAEKDENLKITN